MPNFFHAMINSTTNRKIILWLFIILVCALLFFMVINALFYGSSNSFGQLSNWADQSKYQAVFLSNGQVYFGKVADVNRQTLVLEDIYYLRVSNELQASLESGAAIDQSQNADNFSLIKLGSEIHGPEDKMSINLSQVLFIEDLKDDSKVVEAIGEYRSK